MGRLLSYVFEGVKKSAIVLYTIHIAREVHMGLVSVVVQQDVSKVLRGGIAIANVGGLLTSASVVNEVELYYQLILPMCVALLIFLSCKIRRPSRFPVGPEMNCFRSAFDIAVQIW